MKLTFKRPYKSIQSFEEVELPKFTIVTGRNGAGKSQLLEAIKKGHLITDIVPINHNNQSNFEKRSDIRLLSLTIGLNSENIPYTPTPPVDPKFYDQYFQTGDPSLQTSQVEFRKRMAALLNVHESILSPSRLLKEYRIQLEKSDQLPIGIEEIVQESNDIAKRNGMGVGVLSSVCKLGERLGIPALLVTEGHVQELGGVSAGQPFSVQLGNIFGYYRSKVFNNRMAKVFDEETGERTALSQEEFRRCFGEPPWEVLNESLRELSLNYEFRAPPTHHQHEVPLTLLNTLTQNEIQIAELSQGEKTIFSFILSALSLPHFGALTFPKILLLDEIDSTLNPELIHFWMRFIESYFVDQKGVHVIAVSHSPTTISLAPDGSIYRMEAYGSRLERIEKQEAIDYLTVGIPTLHLLNDKRRQVFVESDTDTGIYEALYSICTPSIDGPYGLTFTSPGVRDDIGREKGGGCGRVRKFVSFFEGEGNKTVYGIIDWDGENKSSDRVKVLAENTADGIENLILDPFLIALLLSANFTNNAPQCLQMLNVRSILTSSDELKSEAVREVCRTVEIDYDEANLIQLNYTGMPSVDAPSEYMTLDDHSLEERLKTAYPALHRYRKRGELCRGMISSIIRQNPETTPAPVYELLVELCS